ncbi:MAG: cupin domain-containing protein [Pseudomonadota bacterium]
MDPESAQSYEIVSTGKGVTRQVLSQNKEMMTVAFRFEAGAIGERHSHPHIQSTYVQDGHFLFYLDDEEHELLPGDSLIIPGNTVHGCKALKPGVLIDTFTPRREEFL